MKYIAKTDIALSVMMNNGKSTHVKFTPVTGGGSVFYTKDAELAQALEKHYKFGKLFRKAQEQPPVQIAPVSSPSKATPADDNSKKKTMTFACYEDAKDYLVETFGISRTKLKKQADIISAAKANGIDVVIED